MQRALIAIGVKKTGGLPELQAALSSAQAMHDWARGVQKLPAKHVKLITDARSKVTRDRVFDEVEKITKLGYIEQLIVYFSGHGINSGFHEQWLLSRAPDDPGAAVNLNGSQELARYAGIRHVVFISDACRTAAEGIQAQSVSGGEIFPNAKRTGPGNEVDQFFATIVGNPAFEVRDVNDAVAAYRAAYTHVLLDALSGKVPSLIDRETDRAVVRPWPLRDHLLSAVPAYLASLGLEGKVDQVPDARMGSRPTAWLAEVPATPAVPAAPPPIPAPSPAPSSAAAASAGGTGGAVGGAVAKRATGLRPPPRRRLPGAPEAVSGFDDMGADMEDAALPPVRTRQPVPFNPVREAHGVLAAELGLAGMSRKRAGAVARDPRQTAPSPLETAIGRTEGTFGPDHFETQCGIKVRGAALQDTYAPHAYVSIGHLGDVVQVALHDGRPGTNVFVKFMDGSAVVVPALRDHITALTVDEGRLRDIAFEPSLNTPRGQAWPAAAREVGRLRTLVAAATSLGVFRLEDPREMEALVERLLRAPELDPALATYAAWALHERRRHAELERLEARIRQAFGARIFDLALLAGTLGDLRKANAARGLFPCVPLLAQAWSLLGAFGVTLPGRLGELRGHLRPALFTHITPAGAGILLETLHDGVVD